MLLWPARLVVLALMRLPAVAYALQLTMEELSTGVHTSRTNFRKKAPADKAGAEVVKKIS